MMMIIKRPYLGRPTWCTAPSTGSKVGCDYDIASSIATSAVLTEASFIMRATFVIGLNKHSYQIGRASHYYPATTYLAGVWSVRRRTRPQEAEFHPPFAT